jgi:hypothetical protein
MGLTSPRAWASLQAVVAGNDAEALTWLANVNSVVDLALIAKEDTDGPTLTGPASADWSLSPGGNSRAGTWVIDNASFTPEWWFVKFDGLIAIYSYMGPSSSPWSDSFDLNAEMLDGNGSNLVQILDENNDVLFEPGTWEKSPPNINAGTSHVSVFGNTAIPEPASLLVWGGLALTCVTRRRMSGSK